MRKSKCFFLIIAFLMLKISYGQTAVDENKTKIINVIENYFDLEREAIHLHLDKTSFITNEAIWYQGYIINRKTGKPFFTTNVYVLLYDEAGNQLSEKLIYASNGVFSGSIDLKSTLHSGNYYIQVYTNWMNNFSENESTITKVNIINPTEGVKNNKKVNPKTLQILLNPEGKSFVNGVANIVGVQVKDCRGNAPENLEVSLQNDNNEILKTFKLNRFGFGKFEITPNAQNLKVSLNYENNSYEKQLPEPETIGFALEVNDFTLEGKTIVKIKTNSTTTTAMASKKYYLLVHQDQKYQLYDVKLNAELEQTISVNNADLAEGINTIRIIDSDMKQWAERLIYIYPKISSTISIAKNIRKADKIHFVGYSSYPTSNLSVSVMPQDTKSWDDSNSIYSGLTLNPYLTEPLPNATVYFNSLGRATYFALDLALLNQEKSKYDWNFMKTTSPTSNYSFDIGINVKGTIDSKIPNKTYHKVKLTARKDLIMMASDITEKGDYQFKYILLADSTYVNMSLQKLPNFEIVPSKLSPQILNRKKPFYKPFKINIPENCEESESEDFVTSFDIPTFSSNTVQLKEIKIINKTKQTLTHENKLGNGYLRGYKIDETLERQDLLSFIENNGFIVSRDFGSVTIYSSLRTTLRSARATPLIYIDERIVMTPDELTMIQMNEIDEIYLNPHAIVPGMNNYEGIIKIYRKKISFSSYNQKPDPNSFYVKEGFSRYTFFKNADYENTQSQGFDNCGLINWSPRIQTDDSGQFLFEITDYNKPKGKVIIEGMTNEGQLFQEEKIIDLN
ncbi:hypothetical protein [Flavobacterium sp.]|uniref:hypothetical protein n=1 Tax=Flavobacterium sp. TaxID=239 RepID=UPI002FD962CE